MKKIIAAALMLVASVGMFSPASAQTIDEVMTKHMAALGGADKITAIKSAQYDQSMSVQGMDLEAKTTIVVGQASRTDVSVMGQTITQVVNGETGWSINPMMGGSTPTDTPADQAKAAKDNTNVMGLQLAMAKMANKTIALVGHETYNGADALKVLVTDGDDKTTYYLHPTNYTITAVKKQVTAEGKTMEISTTLADYKDEAGLLLPHTMSTTMMGQDLTMKLLKFTANPTVDPAIFAKPK